MDRKYQITEELQNNLDEHVEVIPIVRPGEFTKIDEPSITCGILIILTAC